MAATYEGGCHCGAVRFEVDVDSHQALRCNCSICYKKGFLHLIVPRERFRLISGRDSLSTYRFNTGIARHTFCKICGIHPFYTPRSHPDQVDVNIHCLAPEVLERFEIRDFDGVNWQANVDQIR